MQGNEKIKDKKSQYAINQALHCVTELGLTVPEDLQVTGDVCKRQNLYQRVRNHIKKMVSNQLRSVRLIYHVLHCVRLVVMDKVADIYQTVLGV